MIAYKYDKNSGAWIPGEEIILDSKETLPPNYTKIPVPQPCWKPVYKDGLWVETATEEERNPPQDSQTMPSIEDKLVMMEKDVADLWYSFMMGGMV